VILGATGGEYPEIYARLTKIAEECNCHLLQDIDDRLGETGYEKVATCIKRSQFNIFSHIKTIAENRIKEEPHYPDYWNPEPYKKRKTNFSLRVYRKGKWPQRS
jgi:hypothetical protein